MPHIKHIVSINTLADRIYRALTTEKGLSSWWTPKVEIDSEVGGEAIFKFDHGYEKRMIIDGLEPNSMVDWSCKAAVPEWIDTQIRFEIRAAENHSELHFFHCDWPQYSQQYARCSYEWAMLLRSLKNYCETGRCDPYQ
ncbi:MAG: SRPBCC domain-containing protein [Bacteroidota bacterium]